MNLSVVDNSILNIGAVAALDDSITSKTFYAYAPYTNSYGTSEEIRITIQNQDAYLLPSESYLYMQLTISTTNHGVNTEEKNRVKFAHNFASFLFSEAKYLLNGVEIDNIRNVGITSTMKLAAASQSSIRGYYLHDKAFTDKVAENAAPIVYDICIPLSVWFGFCEDFQKVVVNSRHELILKRERDDLNCLHGGKTEANSTNVNITISKLEWMMPHIKLNDKLKMNMSNYLSRNIKLPIQFRSWDMYEIPEVMNSSSLVWSVKATSFLHKPRYVLVAFQNDKKGQKIEDASKFNSIHINNLRLYLNSQEYSNNMHDVAISTGKFAELYHVYNNIQSSYYNGSIDQNLFGLEFRAYQTSPLFAFDTSRSDESIKNGSIDIRLEINATENIPTKTSAYCLIIYDEEFVYSPMDASIG